MIPRPPGTYGLWPEVEYYSVGWPDSDEDKARALAEAWREAGRQFTAAADYDVKPVDAYWVDDPGRAFAQRIRANLDGALTRTDEMTSLANRVDHFADVVIGVKSAIRDLILDNLERYGATRHLGPEDRVDARTSFVLRLAADVDRLTAQGVEQIGGVPLPPDPSTEPPPPPEPGLLDNALTLAGDVVDQGVAFGYALGQRSEAAAGLVLGTGAVVVGGGVALGGGGLAVTGIGAVPGAAVAAGGVALAGTGAVTIAASWEALMLEARTQGGDPVIRNQGLAGGTHPKTGVPFNKDGFPDFTNYKHPNVPDVRIALTGNRRADEAAANAAAGLPKTPTGYTWHHHEDVGLMQLVQSGPHLKTGHTGGYSLR